MFNTVLQLQVTFVCVGLFSPVFVVCFLLGRGSAATMPLGDMWVGCACVATNAVAVVGQHLCQWVFVARGTRAGLYIKTATSAALYRTTLEMTAASFGRFQSFGRFGCYSSP